MERLTPFPGQLTACSCGKQPRLLNRLGPGTYAIECPPCGVRTQFFKSAQEAVACWEDSTKREEIA